MAKPNESERFSELLERYTSTSDDKYARRIARWCIFENNDQLLPVTERHRRLREVIRAMTRPNLLRAFAQKKELVTIHVHGTELQFSTGRTAEPANRDRKEYPALNDQQRARLCQAVAACFWGQKDLTILKAPRLFGADVKTKEEMSVWNGLIEASQSCVVASREDAMTLWKELFREYVPFIERLVQLRESEQEQFAELEHPLLLSIVHSVAVACPGTPMKALLTHLIDATMAHEPDAESILAGVVQLIKGQDGPLVIMDECAFEEMLRRKCMTWEIYELVPPKQRPPEIVLNEPYEHLLRNFLAARYAELTAEVAKMHEVLRWMHEHSHDVAEQFTRKRLEIEAGCTFALLPDGQDHFVISLTPLTCLGIRSIAFYPGGLKPPDTDIRISVQKEGPYPCTFSATLRDLALDVGEHLFTNNIGLPTSLFATLLWMVVIDVLHFITVRNEETRSEKRKTGVGSTFPGGAIKRPVRARLRRLPEGWHASPEALERAQQAGGWVVPEGQTFVKQHERCVHGVTRAADPVCTFSDDLFMESFSAH